MRAPESLRLALVALALALAVSPATARAQRVLGPGEDAVTIPRGALRTTILVENQLFRGRWNDGKSEPLGGGFNVPALNATHLDALATLDNLAASAGVTGLNASLGAIDLDLRQRFAVTRLGFEYGLTNRITLSVNAPFVRSRVESLLRLRADSGIATAGVNPVSIGSGVGAANSAVINAYANAANALTSRRNDCQANAGAHPECATILAELNDVAGLISQTSSLATLLASIYGTSASSGLPFLPLSGSAGEQALRERTALLATAINRYGVTAVSPSTGLPLGAQTPLSAEQLAALIANPSTGFGAEPMTNAARQNLGDVDFTLRFKFRDDFAGDSARLAANVRGIRQTFGLAFRAGGGKFDLPENFIDLPTGSGHNAIALRSYTDLVYNEKYWASVIVGVGQGFAHERVLRVPSEPGTLWLEPWRTSPVRITPAPVIELRVAPRWLINDYFQLGGEWSWRSKGEDSHEVLNPSQTLPFGGTALLSNAALDAQSKWNEQRWAWTIGYSTLASAARGKARKTWEVGYTHEQSIGSSVGIVPRRWEDRVQVRIYTGLFGN